MGYYSGQKRISCFHCGGKLIPSTKSDVMGNADNPIHIQIYKCVDCGNETQIPVYETKTELGDMESVTKSIDEVHSDKLA